MPGTSPYNWDALLERAKVLVREGKVKPLYWIKLANALDVPESTLSTNFRVRYGLKHVGDLMLEDPDADATEQPPRASERTNTLDAGVSSRLVYTLEQLLDACQVDRSVWDVANYVVNQWQYGNRDGVIYPLYQVKAWLVRKKLQAIMPLIVPVELPRLPAAKAPRRSGVRRALIIADAQVGFSRRLHSTDLRPFHDRRVLDLALQLAGRQAFDVIAFLGDNLDLSEWSTKYTPKPEFFWTTQPALLEMAWWLQQFRLAAPKARVLYFEGNHDDRMREMVQEHMRAAYDLRPADEIELPPALSVERLLALHKLHVEYVGNYDGGGKTWLSPRLALRHGSMVRSGSGDTAKAVSGKAHYTTVFGHIHRRELVSQKVLQADGHSIHTAFCPGTACHIDGRLPGSSEDDQWQQGIGVIEYTDETENLVPVAIDAGRMIYGGEQWQAARRDDQINEMLGKALEKIAGVSAETGL